MTNFADLGLSDALLRALGEKGYTTPTPIQEKAIPQILQGRDLLGIAQTGTGKTASFALPILDILSHGRSKPLMPRALIVEPTRELAQQVEQSFTTYSKYLNLSSALIVGGTFDRNQGQQFLKGIDCVIATPGRLLDMFERGQILLNGVQILVLDECDRMLDMGFIPDIEKLVKVLPPQKQTLLFSATIPKEIRVIAEKLLTNPREISVSAPATTAVTVQQLLLAVDEMDKRKALRHLITHENVQNAFIFCNRKKDVDILFKSLQRHGFSVGALHGDMEQEERYATMGKFKSGEIALLVCSDVAARGLDISGVSHVFNFDVPFSADDYVHRIGRTGRAGKSGVAYMLATPKEGLLVKAIEELTSQTLERIEIPDIESPELATDKAQLKQLKSAKPPARGRAEKSASRSRPEKTEHPERVGAENSSGRRKRQPPETRAYAQPEPYLAQPPAPRRYEPEPPASHPGFGGDIPAFFNITRR